MRIVGIIPARYASTRFPGKPLALIAGKPLIQHVVEQCEKAKSVSEIIVATDDTRILEAAQNFCRVEMTSPKSSVRQKDRKSTRLNSSHLVISYAVFCLKK